MRKKLNILILICLGLTLYGCSYLPKVRQLDVSQGNLINQKMVNALRPGMSREQVEYILGSPMLVSPFKDDKMYYIYSFKAGPNEAHGDELIMTFKNNSLVNIQSSLEPGNLVLPQP